MRWGFWTACARPGGDDEEHCAHRHTRQAMAARCASRTFVRRGVEAERIFTAMWYAPGLRELAPVYPGLSDE